MWQNVVHTLSVDAAAAYERMDTAVANFAFALMRRCAGKLTQFVDAFGVAFRVRGLKKCRVCSIVLAIKNITIKCVYVASVVLSSPLGVESRGGVSRLARMQALIHFGDMKCFF